MTDLSPSTLPLYRNSARVALLIDGDNVPPACLPDHEVRARAMGQVVIRRVYADMTKRKDWAATSGLDAFHCASGMAKNHADIRLVIGALDIAHRGLAQAFLILSDDRDFAPLINHLREIGLIAELAGKPKAVPLSPLEKKMRDLLLAQPSGLPLQNLGPAFQGQTVKAITGKATWRAYLTSRPELFTLTGIKQESRAIWCGPKA